MTDIFLAGAGAKDAKLSEGDVVYVRGVRGSRKLQEECDIRLTRTCGVGSIREGC